MKRFIISLIIAVSTLTLWTAKPAMAVNADTTSVTTNTDSVTTSTVSQEETEQFDNVTVTYNDIWENPSYQFIIAIISIIFIFGTPLLIFIGYFIYRYVNRRKQDKARNELLLGLAEKGQTLSPEFLESLYKVKSKEKTTQSSRYGKSIFKLTLGIGLAVISIALTIYDSHNFWLFVPLYIIAFFFIASGLGNYFRVKDERKYGICDDALMEVDETTDEEDNTPLVNTDNE